jgi:hypothetical protein
MKTFFVRGFVLALAVIGFAASTQVSSATATKASVASLRQTDPPTCPLGDPNACGID